MIHTLVILRGSSYISSILEFLSFPVLLLTLPVHSAFAEIFLYFAIHFLLFGIAVIPIDFGIV